MTSLLERLKERYNLKEILGQRYGPDILDFYLKNEENLFNLEDLGYQIWNSFGLLWRGEKHTLILTLLEKMNRLERKSLSLKKQFHSLIDQSEQRKKYEADRDFWDLVLGEHYQKNDWITLNLDWESILSLREKTREELYEVSCRNLDKMIKQGD